MSTVVLQISHASKLQCEMSQQSLTCDWERSLTPSARRRKQGPAAASCCRVCQPQHDAAPRGKKRPKVGHDALTPIRKAFILRQRAFVWPLIGTLSPCLCGFLHFPQGQPVMSQKKTQIKSCVPTSSNGHVHLPVGFFHLCTISLFAPNISLDSGDLWFMES